MKNTIRGALVAAAVAGLFACGTSSQQGSMQTMPAAKTAGTVKCVGVNACKGHGQCGGADHGCAGKNACKGKGWVKTTQADCDAKGGKAQ